MLIFWERIVLQERLTMMKMMSAMMTALQERSTIMNTVDVRS